jgi:ParB-like chromosome segregation protein Spo0J
VFVKPQKIIFHTLLQKIKLNSVKPRQLNLNIELVTQLKIDIKENGLLCPLVIHSNKTLLDGHHRYEAIKDYCTETLVYVVKDKDMENLLSKVNSYMWFDTKGTLND